MQSYRSVQGSDFNKSDNFNFTKLFMHGYKFLNAILTEHGDFIKSVYMLFKYFGIEGLT